MAADNSDNYSHNLFIMNPLVGPVVESAIRELDLPVGSNGLDAGCGICSHAVKLARAVGPEGRIAALDISPEILVSARGFVEEAGASDQITLHEGSIEALPFDDNSMDWAWSADCVGYNPQNPLQMVKELARVVKPGGTVAILAWSSQQLLPGYPLLEARLNTTAAGIAPFIKGNKPESHFLRTTGLLRDAGLKELSARTFAGNVHAPLSDDIRDALTALFQMRWDGAESELSVADWTQYQRLSQPESADFILCIPDYYAFFTYSMFYGKVAD